MLTLLATASNGAVVSRLAYGTFLPGNYGVVVADGISLLPRAVADGVGNTFVSYTVFLQDIVPNMGVRFTADAYVLKVSADGTKIVFDTHVWGGIATTLALDGLGNIYVAGEGGYSSGTGFIVKLAPDGSILYTTQIAALPLAVATDAAGDLYVTGTATTDFKTTAGAYKTAIGPAKCTNGSGAPVACSDAFVAKISAKDGSVIYATFLGGSAADSGLAIAVDAGGSAVVAGQTQSADFPVTPGAFQSAYGGGGVTTATQVSGDGFAARLDPTGSTLIYATFIGGSDADSVTGVVLDQDQNAYLTGSTASSDFPVTAGAFQSVYGGAGDAFFLKLDSRGQALFSSYLGGPTADSSPGIAIGAGNRFYLAVQGYAFILQLDQRSPTPCDPTIAILAVDSDSGEVIDHYAVRSFGYSQFGPGSLSVDGFGVVHVAGGGFSGLLGNSFAVTPNAISNGYGGGNAFLARIDFSAQEEFAPACMVNGASFDNLDVSVAPGEILSLFGVGLGPTGGLTAQPDSNGVYARQLGGTRILIGDTALPLLYVSDSQVNAVVPYSLSTGPIAPGTLVTIEHDSFNASYPLHYIWPTWPGIFTQGGVGSNQAAVLNQDGSTNTADHPAAVGSVVSFFATGLGHLTGPLPDDATTPLSPPWPGLAESFGVYIAAAVSSGAVGMEVLYAGPAPGMPPGVYRVDARVPDSARSGQVPVRFIMSGCDGGVSPCVTDILGPPSVWIQAH